MVRAEMLEWLEKEFLPLKLASPPETIMQIIDNSIRYWNNNSGHKIVEMYEYNSSAQGGGVVAVSKNFKNVVDVYPARIAEWIWYNNPMWTLLGVTILDNVTSDLILLQEAFRNYRVYVGAQFDWTFVKDQGSDDDHGGWLYMKNVPVPSDRICVVGTKYITIGEDIKSDYINDWLLRYSKSLLKMAEGNTLRKSSIVGVVNDGQELMNEGKEEKLELEDKLGKDGRWCAFGRRF